MIDPNDPDPYVDEVPHNPGEPVPKPQPQPQPQPQQEAPDWPEGQVPPEEHTALDGTGCARVRG